MIFFNNIKYLKRAVFCLMTPALLLMISFGAFSQDKIEGVWKSEDGRYMIKVASIGDEFQGRIVWMKDENAAGGGPVLDKKNPDEKLRKLPVKGSKILKDLTYNSATDQWEGGTLYMPDIGRYYKCEVDVKGQKLLVNYEGETGRETWSWIRNG